MGRIESLKKTEVAGDEDVDGIQRGVGGAVGDVFSRLRGLREWWEMVSIRAF